MEEKYFNEFIEKLDAYLRTEKVFVENVERLAEIQMACVIASELFNDATITLKDDALQMGSVVVCIESFDFVVCGTEKINLFQELIAKANNFEIYAKENGNIVMAMMFRGAFTRIKP